MSGNAQQSAKASSSKQRGKRTIKRRNTSFNSSVGSHSNTGSTKKKAELAHLLAQMDVNDSKDKFQALARMIVNPADSQPLVAPSPVPGRAGAAHFPLSFEYTGRSDFGVVVKPSVTEPLLVSHNGYVAESNSQVTGDYTCASGTGQAILLSQHTNNDICSISPVYVQGRMLQSLGSTLGGTFSADLAVTLSETGVNIQFWYYNGGIWSLLGQTGTLGKGTHETVTALVLPPAVGTPTGFSIESTNATAVGAYSTGTFRLVSTGAIWTCSNILLGISEEVVMDQYLPKWDNLKNAAYEFRVVAQSLMITYLGSALNNQGAVACCNANDTLEIIDSFYSTCASRPFDKYDGRLASSGSEPGGAHWHYVPDDPRSTILAMQQQDQQNRMVGFFGVRGMDPTQIVRIRMDIVVNYFTVDPSYKMAFQPSYNGFSELIRALRMDVPLCSSNDDHLKKVVAAARAVAKRAGEHVIANPELMMRAMRAIMTMV
jgi:hypothetical protein